ncbi:MAG: DUF1127 domain-containing protein [Pseudomonadota bacterium]
MTDSSITHSTLKCSTPSSFTRALAALRSYLRESETKRVLRNLPDRLLRDVGLTRGEASLPGDGDSRDAAVRLEVEHLRRRLF